MKSSTTFHLTTSQLFLMDATGATLSLLALTFLAFFNNFSGMPAGALFYLIAIASVLMLFSWGCFFTRPARPYLFLALIILGNCIYTCLSLTLLWYHFYQLTTTGIIYFLLEKVVLVVLISLESYYLVK